jgi:hypothetical protein
MQRVCFYIDGYNFYRGLRDKNWARFYWLDMVKFCSQFLRPHQQLVEVNCFSAIPKDKRKQERFDCFLTANRLNPKFTLLLGKFMEKTITVGDKLIRTFRRYANFEIVFGEPALIVSDHVGGNSFPA